MAVSTAGPDFVASFLAHLTDRPLEGSFPLAPFKGASPCKVEPQKGEAMKKKTPRAGYREVFCRYIIRNGKIMYPKKAKVFHFYVRVK